MKMRALVRECHSLRVRSTPCPSVGADDQVLIKVDVAGLCRTDLLAADGKLGTCESLILGHEFSGTVVRIGDRVTALSVGDRIAANPLVSCQRCASCTRGIPSLCQDGQFLGIDRHGAFASYVAVPDRVVYRVPPYLSPLAAAYMEPVAAALAVLKTGILPSERGLIYGRNRFSGLMQKVLFAKGFGLVEVHEPVRDTRGRPFVDEKHGIEANRYDFAIETIASTEHLEGMLRCIRPGGKLILKSRGHERLSFKPVDWINKEPVVRAVKYGSFDDAIALLAEGRVTVDDLVDGVYELEEFETVFARARNSEALKPFFTLANG